MILFGGIQLFFSRMRSEGFPFIVGVWGWTCVRVVLVVSSWPRYRHLVNSLPLGGASGGVLEDLLLRVKFEGRKSRTKCSFWRFKVSRWEVIFVFCVAGAIL